MFRSPTALIFSLALVGATAYALESSAQAGDGALINQRPRWAAAATAGLGAGRPAPAWKNRSWLNTDRPLTLESLKGRVVLLNFWVFTCYNCTNTVPALVDLDRKYRDQGLTIIGIHTPEFPPYAGEHDRGNLERALEQHGIRYPNAQDNDNATWNLYGIRYWPSFVLIDRKGEIRYEGYGEFHLDDAGYRLWDTRIRELLAESPGTVNGEQGAPARRLTQWLQGPLLTACFLVACRPEPSLVRLEIQAGASETRLTLLAAPGARINARLKPALELGDGTVLRFDSPHLTPDSNYFAESPTATLAGRTRPIHGTLRTSICLAGERVCRTIEQEI